MKRKRFNKKDAFINAASTFFQDRLIEVLNYVYENELNPGSGINNAVGQFEIDGKKYMIEFFVYSPAKKDSE